MEYLILFVAVAMVFGVVLYSIYHMDSDSSKKAHH